MTAHTIKHMVRNMLEGYIQIFTHIWFFCDYIEKIKWELIRISIMEANPLYSLYISHS